MPSEESIGYIDRFRIPDTDSVFETLNVDIHDLHFAPRSEVEANASAVQPICVAVLTNRSHTKIFTVKKQLKAAPNGSSEAGKTLIYVGGHMDVSDARGATNFVSACRQTLIREIREELRIKLDVGEASPIYVYTPVGGENDRHIAVCFVISIDENTPMEIDSNELSNTKAFQPVFELRSDTNLESWSKAILNHCF